MYDYLVDDVADKNVNLILRNTTSTTTTTTKALKCEI